MTPAAVSRCGAGASCTVSDAGVGDADAKGPGGDVSRRPLVRARARLGGAGATRPTALDVSLLQDAVLAPVLGIADVRTDKRIDFVGGIRGAAELERLVDSGEFAVAFSLYPGDASAT